jgi:hypothetical protein
MPSPDASAFATLAAQLQAESDDEITAHTVVRRALQLVEEAEEVSLTIAGAEGRYETLASTGAAAQRADVLQYELREGPCVEVAESASWFRSGDVVIDPRWSRWGPRAGELGMRSVLAVHLVTADGAPKGRSTSTAPAPARSSTQRPSTSPRSTPCTQPTPCRRPRSSPGSRPPSAPATPSGWPRAS